MTTARMTRRRARPAKRRLSVIASRLGELADLYRLGRSLAKADRLRAVPSRRAGKSVT